MSGHSFFWITIGIICLIYEVLKYIIKKVSKSNDYNDKLVMGSPYIYYEDGEEAHTAQIIFNSNGNFVYYRYKYDTQDSKPCAEIEGEWNVIMINPDIQKICITMEYNLDTLQSAQYQTNHDYFENENVLKENYKKDDMWYGFVGILDDDLNLLNEAGNFVLRSVYGNNKQ